MTGLVFILCLQWPAFSWIYFTMRDPVLWGRSSHPPSGLCRAALPHPASWTTHLWIPPGSRTVTSDGHTEVPYLSIFTLLCCLTATNKVFATRQRNSKVSYQSGVKEDGFEDQRFPRSFGKAGMVAWARPSSLLTCFCHIPQLQPHSWL